ncbi:hypothetical protein DMC47_33000 [Nostoc sp. 3335mG]|nr:hypothetical protein DMC47_33000 [Nostoc sp. 3335mG]
MDLAPQIGDRLTDKTTEPDTDAIRDWLGQDAFAYWAGLQTWIAESYPGVFVPEWRHGGQKKGWSLRYKKIRAFCTLVPEYRRLSAMVVFGRLERDKFEDRVSLWRPQLVTLYREATVYPDGLFLTTPVSSAEDSEELKELLTMKRAPTRL